MRHGDLVRPDWGADDPLCDQVGDADRLGGRVVRGDDGDRDRARTVESYGAEDWRLDHRRRGVTQHVISDGRDLTGARHAIIVIESDE
jgi:hypothetical protein